FFFKLTMPYPTEQELSEIIDKTTQNYDPNLEKVLDANQINAMKAVIKEVPVAMHVKEYAIRLIRAFHPGLEQSHESVRQFVRIGPSPRGVQSLILAGKVYALLDNRFTVSIDDIRTAAKPSLRHRLILNLKAHAEGMDSDTLIDQVLSTKHLSTES
ncbi:MAG: hypothetical protein JW795_00835, partial [Chitinivibrionales bacterium]|nr:hypothetical protein [Chitinivibrionales bacterium]